MVTVWPRRHSHGRGVDGFSLVELLIAMAIGGGILGTALQLGAGVQKGIAHQLDDAAVQQEARYALDWIRLTLVSAGSNPYGITTSTCPVSGTPFVAIRLDPNGNGLQDDIRVQADVNPPNGALLGLSGVCTERGEDVTIAHDPVANTLTRLDRGLDTTPVAVTDGIFTRLVFSYLTASRAETIDPAAIAYIRVALTGRSRARNPHTHAYTTYAFDSEIRLRSR